MKNGENYNNSRRNFLKIITTSLLAIPLLEACKEKVVTLLIRLSGTNHILGHRLRVKNFPKPSKEITIPYLIIGGGISGLSAARQLTKKGITDFLMVELEDHWVAIHPMARTSILNIHWALIIYLYRI